MVALMRDIKTNEPVGVHRTALTPDGKKLDRKMLGKAGGACVKLFADEMVGQGLGIAEGIETSLGIIKIGWAPVWACLSAGTLANFPVLNGIEALTVFADNDNAGRSAAHKCVHRWQEAGREARIWVPKVDGQDFAEVAA
jgi:hypothetical protein